MIFTHDNIIINKGSFLICGQMKAEAHSCLCKNIFEDFWHGFSYSSSSISIINVNDLIFRIGNAAMPDIKDKAYGINVEESGVCICAKNEKELIRGFMTFLDLISPRFADNGAEVKCLQITESPCIENRMVHFCIFPQTELWELERFIRFCGALKYSHIVLEFWGMLKYDCMNELSWASAYSKEQIKPLIDMAKDLGMDIIPMFNHWGHASAGRVMHGKHVVLDQNPALQYYFSDDGWCWDIRKPKVRELLRQIRNELCQLCGSGEYFHIGCDEAYNFSFTKENTDFICDFINEISSEMQSNGRRIIAWGDMFLYRYPTYNPNNRYSCNCASPECEKYMLERLSRDVIIADWQYNVKEAPVETSSVFTRAGFECLICPWDRGDAQIRACVNTVKESSTLGIMHTTWHTLSSGMPYVTIAAAGGYCSIDNYGIKAARTHTASIFRKVYPIHGDYRKAGWASEETGVIT